MEESKYGHEEYDPKTYTNKIMKIINEARRHGIRMGYSKGILEIENTVSEDISTIDFNKEFKDCY